MNPTTSRSTPRPLGIRERRLAEALSLLYVAAVAAAASFTGLFYLFFPEMGALIHDVLARPWGKWASQPLRIVITPVITAAIGTLITRHLPYNVGSILLIVVLSLATMWLLRSLIAPAISAGVLPLVFDVKSWLYPLCILGGLAVLAGICILWCMGYRRASLADPADCPDIDDVLESRPLGRSWLGALLLFVALAGLTAQLTGLRFILFPPLVVIAYEMLGHPHTCPWAKRPWSLTAACVLAALAGLIATRLLGSGALAAGASMGCGVLLLRLFDIHMPPALAVGLIPQIMPAPTILYPISVGIGTMALTALFLAYRRIETSLRSCANRASGA